MAVSNAGTVKLHPVLLAAVVVAAVLVVVLVLLAVQQGTAPAEVSDTAGAVLAERAAAPLPDHDRDGTPDSRDPDDDNDGLPDGRDELPLGGKVLADGSFSPDLDQDGKANATDTDDDNDGKPDVKEKGDLKYDHDNDRIVDYKDDDWDNDRRKNWEEKFWVLYGDAKKSDISLDNIDPKKISTYTFADFPQAALAGLTRTSLTTVCYDRDNDRIADASDTRHNLLARFHSDAIRYAQYDNQIAAKYAEVDPSNIPQYQPVHYGYWQQAEASAVATSGSVTSGDPYANFHPGGSEYASHYQEATYTQPSYTTTQPSSTTESGSESTSGGYQYPSDEGQHTEYAPPPDSGGSAPPPADSGGTH